MAALRLREKWLHEEKEGDISRNEAIVEDIADETLRSKRKKAASRACCGIRCALIGKTIAIICLFGVGLLVMKYGLNPVKILLGIVNGCMYLIFWVMMRVWKLQLWAMIHYPTGLENMPEYSASLGCTNASRVFSDAKTTFAVPIASVAAVHSLDIAGSAVGTLTIAQSLPDASDIKYETLVHSNDPTLLDLLTFTQAPLSDHVDSLHESRVVVEMPAFDISTGACVRYDMTVYIPASVTSLDIRAHGDGALQLKFDERSNFEMDALSVTIDMSDSRNLILPHKGIRADIMTIGMAGGWLVGDVAIVNETRIGTEDGNVTLNAHIYPAPSYEDPPAPAKLDTTTGSGPSSYIFYMADAGHSRRPIQSVHRSLGEDMLWLVYPQVTVNGTVNITASNYPKGRLEHHDPDGPDSIVSQSDGPIVFFAHSF